MHLLQVRTATESNGADIYTDQPQRICVDGSYFDADYFERGPQSGKSLYENYHYIPERSEKTAKYLTQLYPGKTILDFGCAKGFLVKALREMDVRAWGYDISDYAIDNCLPEVKPYLRKWLCEIPVCDVVVGKDVLEHIPHLDLVNTLRRIARRFKEGAFVVPLGDDGKYRIDCYHLDKSHLIAENESFWYAAFKKSGWTVDRMSYDISAFKGHWLDSHEYGNAVFSVSSNYLFD